MLPTRDISVNVMQLENQRFHVNNSSIPLTRQGSSKTHNEMNLSCHSQPNNIPDGVCPVTNSSAGQGTVPVCNGFYSSSTFNTITNFEASYCHWFSENRVPNNSMLLNDKTINSGPSHSCCVNRLGTTENIGMCSPLTGNDTYRTGRDTGVPTYQTKPPALSVNVIDSVQNWFNLPPISNQPYPTNKFSSSNDQNISCSQVNLPIIEQAELKQNDLCLQLPDTYFDQSINNSNNKVVSNSNINELNNGKLNENDIPSTNVKGNPSSSNSGYQTNITSSKEWKQPSMQETNYIPSPTLFSTLSDSPDHYLYTLPVPTSNSYCMVTENINNKMSQQSSCNLNLQQNIHSLLDKQHHNSVSNSRSIPYHHIDQLKLQSNQMPQLYPNQYLINNSCRNDTTKQIAFDKMNAQLERNTNDKINQLNINNNSQIINSNLSSNNLKNCKKYSDSNDTIIHYSSSYNMMNNAENIVHCNSGNNDNRIVEQKLLKNSANLSTAIVNDETSSGSEESNIIVEESDETEEIDSVISIDEMKKTFMTDDEPVELRCLVCNVKSSLQTPATNFIHMNDSFPLTSASKTPVASKLIQILPTDLQHFLKLHNSFMCRRCLNLIETVEVLEVKLTSVKQTLSENFSKTVQYFLPATPILEIENGKAKIIDNEIIPSIEESLASKQNNNLNSEYSNEQEITNKSVDKDVSENETEEEEEFTKENQCVDDNIADIEMNDLEEEEKRQDEVEKEDGINDETADDFISEKDDKNKCKICSKVLSNIRSYNKHMELHFKSYSYYCEFCGKGFNLKQSLEKHLLLHDSESNRYQCEKCGITYTQKHRLQDHLKKHLGEFKLNCEECGKGFMDKTALDIHRRSHTKELPFICEVCGSRFIKESNLKMHLKEVCKKDKIRCNLCSNVFDSVTNLKKHEISNHNIKPKKECHICGKVFVNVKDLKPHLRLHSDDNLFVCEICNKSYKSVGNLNQHAKIHDVDKLFKCTLCNATFSRKKTFEDHMNRHTGNRIYKCSDCDKSYFDRKHLHEHIMKTHSDEIKIKMCPVCSKKINSNFEVHMRSHNGVRPYVCNHCGLCFSINRTLQRHIQSKHQNVIES